MKPVAEMLRDAVALHQQGQLDEAEKHYKKVLRTEPRQFEALNLLGLLKQQQGDSTEALRLMDLALKINPDTAETLMNYGGVLCTLNRHQEAITRYDRAVALRPDLPEMHYNRGNALMSLARYDEALACYDRTLALRPGDFLAHYNRGILLIAINRHEEALASFDRALALRPKFPDALINRGKILLDFGRPEDALASFDRALTYRPNDMLALQHRGAALVRLDRFEDVLAAYERVLALDPDHVPSLINRGTALMRLDRHNEALASYARALSIDPNNIDALTNKGSALNDLGMFEEALAAYERALALRPDHPEAKWTRGFILLSRGRFTEGWNDYESRWKAKSFPSKQRDFKQPRWNGARVKGTLLAWGEQGLGDEILHGGMVGDLASHADVVKLEIEPRLANLFARSFPNVQVIPRGDASSYGAIDQQVPLGSIGEYLRPNWQAFPKREQGYLTADRAQVASLRKRLVREGEVVLGTSWVSKNKSFGRAKTASLIDFAPVLGLPGCRVVDLQYGDTRVERETLKAQSGIVLEHLDDIDNMNDIDGLAALISACDLVVTVSNTTAHLAGALGVATWVLVPPGNAGFWYWFKERDDSPWYPRVNVRRLKKGQTWPALVASVAGEISAFVQTAKARQPA
jgi:tetratricopeptide (TPR) repeat protein